jgi:hypothetical protein
MDHSPAERQGHPLQFLFRQWKVNQANRILSILKHHDVPLVLSGHIHAQSASKQDGILNLTTSAVSSYPHAWRTVTVEQKRITVETRRIRSLPSLPDLQIQSRNWMSEGMGLVIKDKAAEIPMLAPLANELSDFVCRSGWWPRFCDGTLPGFRVNPELTNGVVGVSGLLFKQVAAILDDFGRWKMAQPDANSTEVEI